MRQQFVRVSIASAGTKQSGGLFVGKGRHGRKSRFPHQKSRIVKIRLFLSKPQVWYIISPLGLDNINNGLPLLYIITL